MKKSIWFISLLVLIFTLTSCGNLNAGKTDMKRGRLTITLTGTLQSADSEPRAVNLPTVENITDYSVRVFTYPGHEEKAGGIYSAAALNTLEGFVLGFDTYVVEVNALKEGLEVAKGTSEPVTISLEALEATATVPMCYNLARVFMKDAHGNVSWSEYVALTGTQLPSAYAPDLEEIHRNGPTSDFLTGWKDMSNRNESGQPLFYDVDSPIPLDGKTLPLDLECVWDSPSVRYKFDPNYEGSFFQATDWSGFVRGDELLIPDYMKYTGYQKQEYGVFNDVQTLYEYCYDENYGSVSTPSINMDPYIRLSDAAGSERYIFCGWSVNVALPVLTGDSAGDGNYDDNLEAIKTAKIVQPGERYVLKDSETTFYAVWARDDLRDKLLDVCYEWGDGYNTLVWSSGTYGYDSAKLEYDGARTRSHVFILIDNLRTDAGTGYDTYQVPLKSPVIADIFPQFNAVPEDRKGNTWTKSYMTEGSVFNYIPTEASGCYTFRARFSVPILECHSDGNWYSGNEDEVFTYSTVNFPLPVDMIDVYYAIPETFVPKARNIFNYEGEFAIYELNRWYTIWENTNVPLPDELNLMAPGMTLPITVYAEWKLTDNLPDELYYPMSYDLDEYYNGSENIHIITSVSDLEKLADTYNNEEHYSDNKRYYLGKSLVIDELTASLAEDFQGDLYGLGNSITVENASVPLFDNLKKNTGYVSNAEISDLTVKGTFNNSGSVFCSTNTEGNILNCVFDGTATGVRNIFGTLGSNGNLNGCSIKEGSNIGYAVLYGVESTMLSISQIAVDTSVGTGAFANASSESPVEIEAYEIGETEVTYAEWYEVYHWAADNGYTFAGEGREGDDGVPGAAPTLDAMLEPVTGISWLDSVVWCNAASEMRGLEPVYYYGETGVYTEDDTLLRNANADGLNMTKVTTKPVESDSGYRLPTRTEWEYAARGTSDYYNCRWDSDWPETFTGYVENDMYLLVIDTDHTEAVKSRKYDSEGNNMYPTCYRGLFGVSGNVSELTFTQGSDSAKCIVCGGNYASTLDECKVSDVTEQAVDESAVTIGFRLAR